MTGNWNLSTFACLTFDSWFAIYVVSGHIWVYLKKLVIKRSAGGGSCAIGFT